MSHTRKDPSLKEMWKVIERYGIKQEMFERSHPTNQDILVLYNLIKQKKHKYREDEMVKLLKEHVEKIKKRDKS
ncbi:MAG TPA: hypothetical protein VEU72_06240 [Nitrosopumilaceae archaeon]|nr:hypothetical protein [Nitrosopumilaceae archaeon]